MAESDSLKKILNHSGIVWNCWTGALEGLPLIVATIIIHIFGLGFIKRRVDKQIGYVWKHQALSIDGITLYIALLLGLEVLIASRLYEREHARNCRLRQVLASRAFDGSSWNRLLIAKAYTEAGARSVVAAYEPGRRAIIPVPVKRTIPIQLTPQLHVVRCV